MDTSKIFVDKERIKSEKDLIYWDSVKRVFDEVKKKMSCINKGD